VHFIALSLFFLLAKFYAYWCVLNKVAANDKVGHFLKHDVYCNISVVAIVWLNTSSVRLVCLDKKRWKTVRAFLDLNVGWCLLRTLGFFSIFLSAN